MTSLSDFPPDVQAAAKAVYAKLGRGADADEVAIAKALKAEREACAVIADQREAVCADAVAKIDTGDLYVGNPAAKATENCARLEAQHIARLIRRDPGAPPRRPIISNPGIVKEPTMDSRPPIDLPDDFGLDDPDYGHTVTWIACSFLAVLIIAALAVIWVVLS